MLVEQTLEKLTSMRLLGMAAFLRTFLADPKQRDIAPARSGRPARRRRMGPSRERAPHSAAAQRAAQAAGLRRGHRLLARARARESRRFRNCKPRAGFARTRTS